MIKFFRTIRYKLMNENKTNSSTGASAKAGKYFKYAIGEIVLVVIGILIALQINNWNENRKSQKIEIQLLKNLRSSLQSDIKNQINPNLENLTTDLRNIEHIKKFIKNNEVYHDSMNIKFNTLMYSKNNDYEITSYKALENQGLQIIKNDELKTKILKLYNTSYPNLEFIISNFSNNLIAFYRPNMRELFLFLDNNKDKGYIPENYTELRTNRDFKNNLIVCTENLRTLFDATKAIKTEIEQLITLIDKELNNRD